MHFLTYFYCFLLFSIILISIILLYFCFHQLLYYLILLYFLFLLTNILIILIILIILQVNALLETFELQQSAGRDHFALYNCLVLGLTKYNGVQRISSYCNPIPDKPSYDSHQLNLIIIRQASILEHS